MIEKRFLKLGNNGLRPAPLIFTTTFDCTIDLLEPEVIGRELWLRRVEKNALQKIKRDGHFYTIAPIEHAPHCVDHEYRAEFDEERWKSEIIDYEEKPTRRLLPRMEAEQQRLRTITIQALMAETLFQDWDNRTQIVPPEFALGVRTRSKVLLKEVDSLGEKPKRKDVRKLLKEYVFWLNSFDGSVGYEIETEEREDLMGFVEEVCWATRQKPLIGEADNWRNW